MEYTDYEKQLLDKKVKALALLSQFGFVDNEDDEDIGSIFHFETGLLFNVRDFDPINLIPLVFKIGKSEGRLEAKAEIRTALGI